MCKKLWDKFIGVNKNVRNAEILMLTVTRYVLSFHASAL